MKKLTKLSLLKNAEMLRESEMKLVVGGYSGEGSCGVNLPSGAGGPMCGISKSLAVSLANSWGVNWCCDSCSSTSYCY